MITLTAAQAALALRLVEDRYVDEYDHDQLRALSALAGALGGHDDYEDEED